MQELVLVQPGRVTDRFAAANDNDGLSVARDKEEELAHEAAQPDTRREFEERLAECGPLAYRVARGVLRNTADAEDVAQEALLRAYRRFDRLRDRNRFRAWLVRIAFRLALDRLRSGKRRELRHSFGRSRSTSRLQRLPKTSRLRTNSKGTLRTPLRNCRRSCGWSFCLRLWRDTPLMKLPGCWEFPRVR